MISNLNFNLKLHSFTFDNKINKPFVEIVTIIACVTLYNRFVVSIERAFKASFKKFLIFQRLLYAKITHSIILADNNKFQINK